MQDQEGEKTEIHLAVKERDYRNLINGCPSTAMIKAGQVLELLRKVLGAAHL